MLLDQTTAEAFLDDPSEENHFLLTEANEVTDEAAELLVQRLMGNLPLLRVRQLSEHSAEILAGFSGDLFLDGLTNPSPEVLAKLTARSSPRGFSEMHNSTKTKSRMIQYRSLSLNGINHLDQKQAEALAGFNGKLDLSGLTEIQETCSKIIGLGSFWHLYLDGLRMITAKALGNLLRARSAVTLNGLETLPDIQDDWDDLEDGIEYLHLNGLKFTTSRSLKKVASVASSEVYLNGLECLPQDDQELFDNCGAQLYLGGLRKLTDIDLKIFGESRPSQALVLDGLEELDVRQAKQLVGSDRGTFSIGLRKMSDDVADVLLRSQSYYFIMDRLEELTPFAASICGQYIHAETVSFNGLQQISDDAFQLLLADYSEQNRDWCPGSVLLDGLRRLSPRMQKVLEETKHDVSLSGIR
jgi:hypothetical protein